MAKRKTKTIFLLANIPWVNIFIAEVGIRL
jgi:hypothetical protein